QASQGFPRSTAVASSPASSRQGRGGGVSPRRGGRKTPPLPSTGRAVRILLLCRRRRPEPRSSPAPEPVEEGSAMRHGKRLGLAALALALLAGPANAQTTLRYKFKDGEKLQYVMDQDMKMTMSIGGMDIEMKMKQGMDFNWDIGKVDDQGNAQVRVKVGRV